MSSSKRFLDVLLSEQRINLEQYHELVNHNFNQMEDLWQHLQACYQFRKGELMAVLLQHIRLPDAQLLLKQQQLGQQKIMIPMEYRLVKVRNSLELQPANEFLKHYPKPSPEALAALQQAKLLTPNNIALFYVELHFLISLDETQKAKEILQKLGLKPQEQPIINRLIAMIEFKEQHYQRVIQLLLPQLPNGLAAEWLWLLGISGLKTKDLVLCQRTLSPISQKQHYLQQPALDLLAGISP